MAFASTSPKDITLLVFITSWLLHLRNVFFENKHALLESFTKFGQRSSEFKLERTQHRPIYNGTYDRENLLTSNSVNQGLRNDGLLNGVP